MADLARSEWRTANSRNRHISDCYYSLLAIRCLPEGASHDRYARPSGAIAFDHRADHRQARRPVRRHPLRAGGAGTALRHGAGVLPVGPEQDRGPARSDQSPSARPRRSFVRAADRDQACDLPDVRNRLRQSADPADGRRLPVHLRRVRVADLPDAGLRQPLRRPRAAGHGGTDADLCRARDVVGSARLLGVDPDGAVDGRSVRDLDRCADPLRVRTRIAAAISYSLFALGERMNFASDNAAGVAPEILAAIAGANEGAALAYGRDRWTQQVERKFTELFEREVAVFLVATGTAANALALAHLTPPWGAVLCHAESHIATDECGAPEFFGGGLKLIGLSGDAGRIAPATLQHALEQGQWGGPHHVSATVLSLSQATEAGTIYRPAEIQRLAEIAHGHGLTVHVDGARFGNALVRMNASPAEATWKAGVDALSFGATKGGALAAEAVVFFDPARGADMQSRRKRGGHLLSKHRFVAAQMEAYLAGGRWLALARHANDMADRLSAGLAAAGLEPVWPVEANEVFVALPPRIDARLKAAGASYYPWSSDGMPGSVAPDAA